MKTIEVTLPDGTQSRFDADTFAYIIAENEVFKSPAPGDDIVELLEQDDAIFASVYEPLHADAAALLEAVSKMDWPPAGHFSTSLFISLRPLLFLSEPEFRAGSKRIVEVTDV